MVNNIFKALYLIVAICLAVVLLGIYRNMERGDRYIITTAGQHNVNIFDTKTRKMYNYNNAKFYDQNFKEIKEIPK